MKIRIPSPLLSYTQGRNSVEVPGTTLAEGLTELDRLFPGLRFRIIDEQDRIREHILIWVAGRITRHLAAPVGPKDEIMIVAALSGG